MTMTVKLPDAEVQTLTQAAIAFRQGSRDRPQAAAVVTALLQAEKASKRSRTVISPEALVGQWRLCFTTSTRKAQKRGGIVLGKGFYLPRFAVAQIAFIPVETLPEVSLKTAPERNKIGTICNQLQVGFLLLKFAGYYRYLGKRNLLAFDFTHLQLSLFGRTLFQSKIRSGNAETFEQQSIAQLPFFTFFLATDELVAARGRGGGLAIWIRDV